MANELLAMAYETVNPAKTARLRDCATYLVYLSDGECKRLEQANFCRVRLCPVCAWRRCLKVYGQVAQVLQAVQTDKPMAYLLLTLTVRNCTGPDLSNTLDSLMSAYNRLFGYVDVKRAVKGWYRGVEVVHNLVPDSPSYDTYHPHIHCLVAVKPSYFTDRSYLSQKRWQAFWKRAARLDYDPQVDVRRVRGNTASAIAEVAKYASKESDYLIAHDWDLTVDTVRLLDEALNNRRFAAFGGILKDWHRKLNLDDPDDGDLIHADDERPPILDVMHWMMFVWYSGYRQYVRE